MYPIQYHLGVDGGGSWTRAVLAGLNGNVIGQGQAGPSALGQGIAQAWDAVTAAIVAAFESAGITKPDWSQCHLGVGLAGVSTPAWKSAFLASDPGFATLLLETDDFTMLLGAHAGEPGVIISAGTGAVGAVLRKDGTRTSIGGWGFPVGDVGSGAWLGMQAVHIAQDAMDERANAGLFVQEIWAICGQDRDAMQTWCKDAGQFAYARLAPIVFKNAQTDSAALQLLKDAALALERMAFALDPEGQLSLAVCGSVGRQLTPYFSEIIRARCIEPQFEAVIGALMLVLNRFGVHK